MGLLIVGDLCVGGAMNLWAQNPRAHYPCFGVCYGKCDSKIVVYPEVYRTFFADYKIFRTSAHHHFLYLDCHTDVAMISQCQGSKTIHCLRSNFVGIVVSEPVKDMPKKYRESIHDKTMLARSPDTPDFQGYHTAHNVCSPNDPQSTVYQTHIIEPCGKCHIHQPRDYFEGILDQTLEKEDLVGPIYNDCHLGHNVLHQNV